MVIARRHRLSPRLDVPYRTPRSGPAIAQDQRTAWIGEMLVGTSESLPYRAARMLLLLLAHPLVKVVALRVDAVRDSPAGMTIEPGTPPLPCPNRSQDWSERT